MFHVCLVCGGQSAEHEVSLRSALSIFRAFPRDDYSLSVVGITHQGEWRYFGDRLFVEGGDDSLHTRLADDGLPCFIRRQEGIVGICIPSTDTFIPCDIAFPMMHGTNGEDGTIQGFFQLCGLPCVGCDAASSANCMDKDLTKILLEHQGLTTSPGIVLRSLDELDTDAVIAQFGLPLFVKPAKTGSSVGISKVKTADGLVPAVREAFEYDTKVLIEKAIVGREIECAVLDDGEKLFCALPGEVIPHDEFYSYAAKYLTDDGATLAIPATLTEEQRQHVRSLACQAFRALDCRIFSRVDFFFTPDGQWIVNEINTIPGFTKISLYPQLMNVSGIDYTTLIRTMLQGTLVHARRLRSLKLTADKFLA